MPNYAYAFGGFYVDPLLVERIEVLKGASSVLYGGSNPGGLVNYVSKAPTGETSTEVETGADDSGRFWISFDQNGKLSANTDYRLLGKLERVDGHGAFDDGVHGVLSGSLRHRLEGGAELTFGLDYMKVDEKHVGAAWLPYEGTVTRAPFGYIDRDFNSGEPDHDRYERDQVALRATWQQDLGGWHFTNNSRIAWSRVEEDSVYAYGYSGYALSPVDEDGTMARLVFDHSTDTTTVLNDARLETSVDAFGAEHRLMIVLDLKYFRLDQMQASATGTPLTFVDPVYGAAQPDAVPYIDQVLTQRQAGLYLQDQIRWGNGWIATGNLRYDWVKTETGTNRATGAEGGKRTDGEASWRIGLARTLANGVTPYVSASTYFNPQVVNDANGSAISPETGRQIEAGVKWSPNDRFLLTAAAFDLRRENISQSAYDWDAGGYVYQQLGEVRSRGIEFEAQGDLGNGLVLNAELTKMEIEVRDDVDTTIIGKTPYSLPEETAALKLAWTPEAAPDWTFTGGVRYVGSSWADNANTLKVPGRTLYDLGVSHRFSGGWQANLVVTNLFDKTYVASCQTA
ncbi:TonB-dependent siderophore receptor [Sinirhodobacter populi]|uniref:TonB-dependent siderophore receptor n=1 Tax=Paenirhodobacter populi TaxID=2306993 RepID=A0A443K4I0_9RHOB|nr:TonB-dependent siderophore receptor [Sinirhodobacter populi]